MDSGESGANIVLVIVIGILLVANFYFRKRKTESTPLGMVASIFSELNYNQKLAENFGFHRGGGKFKTVSWKRGHDKIDFLPMELRNELSKIFETTEDFNERIDAARKYGSDSYLAGIDVDKLKGPLAKNKQELQEWLQENMQNPEYAPPRRRGLFG
ncbi:hypothetical protein ACFLUZ_02035 [Chloroflexota bacterium]